MLSDHSKQTAFFSSVQFRKTGLSVAPLPPHRPPAHWWFELTHHSPLLRPAPSSLSRNHVTV